MIVERGVLLGIQHFKQRGRRIAAEIHRHLVDFIEQEERIVHARLHHVLNDLAGHGADIRAAVAANFRFVAHTAERHPHELPIRRARDRLTQRCLADARRSDETQDRTLQRLHPLLDRQILDDALLHLLETVVILVEHLFGDDNVSVDL